MTDPRDVVHQIEYRWQHEKDLSPFATTMSLPMTAGWDDLIRSWVRHPHVARLSESVCYKVWDHTGDAALAWRYRDQAAAERTDGTSGRPHVSRVLVGHASVLSPEVAIALSLLGLPPSAQPQRVSAPDELPTISPDELTAVHKVAAELDDLVAQDAGLLELVAAALSDRDKPLAVYLPEDLIARPLGSPQSRLLWGLHRIMRIVPGAGRRGWSFSTFELPLGAQDATTLPDIVFRTAVRASAPPGIVRDEVKAWPLDPDEPAALRPPDVGRARWLVEAYAGHGVDGVERLLADDQARSVQAVSAPVQTEAEPPESIVSGPVMPEMTALQGFAVRLPPLPTLGPTNPLGHGGQQRDPLIPTEPSAVLREPADMTVNAPPSPSEPEQHAPQPQPREWGRHHRDRDSLGSRRQGQAAPPLPLASRPSQPPSAADYVQPAGFQAGQDTSRPPGRIDLLLKQMRRAPDSPALHEILQFIVASRTEAGRNERQEARRIMSHDDWYDSVAQSSGYRLGARELAGIFEIIVIPDLGKAEDVTERIAGWADGADPEMICGLLVAARDAMLKERTGFTVRRSKNLLDQVRQIMLPRLASRWTREMGIAEWWDLDHLP